MYVRHHATGEIVDGATKCAGNTVSLDEATGDVYACQSGVFVKINGGGSGGHPVDSVFGRIGNISAQAGDYNANKIDFVPAGGLGSTDVQAAIEELDAEKQPVDSDLTALAGFGGTGLLTRLGAASFTGRTLQAGAGISIANGDGVAGDPVITATGAGTVGKYAANFASTTTLTVPGFTHGLGGDVTNVVIYDNSSPRKVVRVGWTVDDVTFDVVVNFAVAQAGRIVISA